MMFLGFDTETGGLDPAKHSLLTLCLAVLTDELDVVDRLDLAVQHETYHVTAEALKINKINLVDHHAKATPRIVCQTLIDNFLAPYTKNYNSRLTLLGHNVPFDRDFIKGTFNTAVWDKATSYHLADSVGFALLAKLTGKISKNQSLKLEELTKLFGIPHEDSHTAGGDVLATIAVTKKLMALFKGESIT